MRQAPWWKWLLVALAGLLGLYLLTAWGLQQYVERKLDQYAAEKTGPADAFSYGSVSTSLLGGKIDLTDLDLTAGPGKLGRQLRVRAAAVRAVGISWTGLVFSEKITLDKFTVDRPDVTLGPAIETAPPDTAGPPPRLRHLKVGRLAVREGTFREMGGAADSVAVRQLDSFSLRASGIKYLFGHPGPDFPLTVEEADLALGGFRLRNLDGHQGLSFQRLYFNKQDSLVELTGLALMPAHSKDQWARRLPHKKSRLDLKFPKMTLSGWCFAEALRSHLCGRTLVLEKPEWNVFTDKSMTPPPGEQKQLPQTALRNLGFRLSIDTVRVQDAALHYEERPAGQQQAGQLWLAPLHATLVNLTNDSARIRQDKMLTAEVSAALQRRHHTHHRFWFDLASPDDAFSFRGQVSAFPFAELNPFLRPAGGIAFQAGTVDSISFAADANRHTARGDLTIKYHDLEFTIFNKKQKPAGLLTKAVDLLLVRDDNRPGTEDFRPGTIAVERQPADSFFKFWWRAIESGLRGSLTSGLAPKE